MTSIKYEKDSNNIVHIILDKEQASANLMDLAFSQDLASASQRLAEESVKEQGVAGVIIRSTKSSFFAGGDLNMLYQSSHEKARELFDLLESIKASLRIIETIGKPVVACIAGAAMGGGWEIALACHHRIAVNSAKVVLGLPEVTLGLLPGGGGVTRRLRLLGLEKAMPYLLQGKTFKPEHGQKLGLVHHLVEQEADLIPQAISWIKSHQKQTELISEINAQPWDIKGYKIPGGSARDVKVARTLPITPSIIRNTTQGCLPAPDLIFATMVEGTQVDFDSAARIESRYFVELATGQISKNLINTFWYQLNDIKGGINRPDNIAAVKLSKVGVLGAGMMGAGIAYSCALKGICVVLKDISLEQAEKGKDYSRNLINKQIKRGRLSSGKAEQILSLIQPTAEVDDLADCELVIEAVFEDRALKAQVTKESEQVLSDNAIFASNTSTLPISGLATAAIRPQNFIGMHFFSPVDKMQLVEIICGQQTSDEALALCYDLIIQLGKTPIVVNDSRGFYTSRVFETFVKEGIAMLRDAHPASIENAAYLVGFPVGPLAVTDEVSLSLMAQIGQQTKTDLEKEGKTLIAHPSDDILEKMIAQGRTGRSAGGGFFDYPENAKKHLSPVLAQFNPQQNGIPLADIKDRLLFIMAIEAARCVEEGVLRSTGDANIGSVFGIGFPQWTGGTLQFINQYGFKAFVKRADELADGYGERFNVPALLRDMMATDDVFS